MCACYGLTVHSARLLQASTRSPSALSGRFSVPRLALPTCESPTAAAAGGLTRSTRRALTGTPGGVRSPSPYGSPTRRSGTCDSGEQPALAELSTLASALGESLVAADLPAIVAHKRRADMQAAEAEEDGVPQGEGRQERRGTDVLTVLAWHVLLMCALLLRQPVSALPNAPNACTPPVPQLQTCWSRRRGPQRRCWKRTASWSQPARCAAWTAA